VLYVAPNGISDSIVYDIQSTALILACAIRFSAVSSAEERVFFRDLTAFVVVYGVLSAAGVLAQDYGSPAGGITDLAWSFPVFFFCALTLGFGEGGWEKEPKEVRSFLPPHVHGVSSMGLALTSMAAAAILTAHRPAWGITGLAFSCVLLLVRTALREARLQQAQMQLQHTALHDALTGLPNRNLLVQEMAKSRQAQRGHLLFLDIDRFKIINDSLGHEIGDRLLVHVGRVLRAAVSPEDIVARLGGDEFVILLRRPQSREAVELVADRVLKALREPVRLGSRGLCVTGSIGIVEIAEENSMTDLLRDADSAMYKAKTLGRNRARIFDETLLEEKVRELDLEAALRLRIEEHAIAVHYQPIYSLQERKLTGFEALARWTDPQYGPIDPGEFIPLAEETGLILELGRQVLRVACAQMAAWNAHFASRVSVSVNASGLQLLDQGFVQDVSSILTETGLEPSLLRLEVTESILIEENQLAGEVLNALRSKGVEVWLDDFGTGYSSLNCLLEVPFDCIKIDKAFLPASDQDRRRTEVLKAILQMAKYLEKEVIAEGIETTAQLELLTDLGCGFGQGFLFSQPVPSSIAGSLLQIEKATEVRNQACDPEFLRWAHLEGTITEPG
jgi:diguanylate cyclase (GGDEF)-like protein